MKASAVAMAQPSGKLEGRHVLAIFVGFFGIIFAVNIYFLVSALSTNTGVVAVEPYRKGLAYNQRIAAGDAQNALGWKETAALGKDGRLIVNLTDRDGKPVPGLKIVATVGRPSTEKFDHKVTLASAADGAYVAELGTIADGTWLLSFEARKADGEEPVYRGRHRLWLKP